MHLNAFNDINNHLKYSWCFCIMDYSSWWQLLRLCNVLFRMVKASRAKACGHEGNSTLISRIFPAVSSSNLLVPRYRRNQHADFAFPIARALYIVHRPRASRVPSRVPSNIRVPLSPNITPDHRQIRSHANVELGLEPIMHWAEGYGIR